MDAHTKAYEEKVRAELQQAKSQLEEFEARSKAQDKRVATDLINQLKKTHQRIEKERQKLETSAVEEMEQEKTEIDAGLDKLRAGRHNLQPNSRLSRGRERAEHDSHHAKREAPCFPESTGRPRNKYCRAASLI